MATRTNKPTIMCLEYLLFIIKRYYYSLLKGILIKEHMYIILNILIE